MLDKYVIYHNPRCSKSRSSLSLLEANIEEKTIIIEPYLHEGVLNEALLTNILELLSCKSIDICRTGEKTFKELGLKKDDVEYKIFEAILKNPILLQRPIIVKNGKKAVIGRPPENVLKLLENSI